MSELRAIQQTLVGLAYERRDTELAMLADRMSEALRADELARLEAHAATTDRQTQVPGYDQPKAEK